MRSPVRLTGALKGRTAAVTIAGVATALLGTGTASAAALTSATHAHTTASAHHAVPAKAAGHGTKLAAQAAAGAASAQAKPAAAPAAPQPAPTWNQIQQMVASQTSPAEPQAANVLQPVPTSGPQNTMQISPAQQANATTIVQEALAKKMGIRSAVVAVATSMQESQLQNINYGDQDSLGLFQQRPSMGWGTAQQIMDPQYAADSFLTALQQYQASNPGWASQPLWATAQGVQKSGVPTAYAQWESQASQLVQQIVTQVK
jgi:hypothetical protein